MFFLSRYHVEPIFIHTNQHIGNYRFMWIQKYLTDAPTYCSIFCTDLRDAYFQGTFFEKVEQFGITQFGIKSTEDYVLLAQGLSLLLIYSNPG